MAAASGPVQTSSGETVDADDPCSSNSSECNLFASNEKDEFKIPVASTIKADRKSDTPATATESIDQSKKSLRKPDPGSSSRSDSTFSSAEHFKHSQLSIPYKEPIWSGSPPDTEAFSFDVLKNGTIVENIELRKKPWIVFGRLPSCDVFMEHPSLSRYHAVVQYCATPGDGYERGWYLYDLDSTHGTWVNKVKVLPKTFHRLHVDYVVKFGGSSRLHILQGPESDKEPESEQSISELKAQRERLRREAELLRMAEDEELESQRQKQQAAEDRGCSWGMGEDAMEETEENPFANMGPQHEHLYADDPKKALKGFYEREGYDLPEYQFSEVSFGKHRCFLELPVEGANGEALVAEATVSGKKKEAVVACALEACRLLDIHGILHASKHESRKRKKKNWEDDDFYDSDEDTFLDRTGTIEKKRLFRMKKSGKDAKAETYETLVPKWNEVVNRIGEIEKKLQEAKAQADAIASEEDDALDAYMTAIKAGIMDTKTRLTLKRELLKLRTEEQRLRHLVNIAKPASLPVLKIPVPPVTVTPSVTSGTRKIGVARGPKPAGHASVSQDLLEKESTFEEEDEEEDGVADCVQPSSKDNQEVRGPLSKDNQEVQDFSRDLSHISRSQDKANKMIQGFTTSSGPKIKASLSMSSSLSGKVYPDHHTETGERLEKSTDRALIVKKQVPVSTEASTKDSSATIKSEETKPQVLRLSVTKKKKKVLGPPKREYDSSDPDYAVWLPPEDQTGDGRTSLNDKLGY